MALTRLEKEATLRREGIAVRPYPTLDRELAGTDALAADRGLIAAGSAWEHEIDRLYLQLLQKQETALYAEEVRLFSNLCNAQGMRAALTELNDRVPHRYTAVYRLRDMVLSNVELIDKLGAVRPEFLAEVPLTSSFCQYVLRDGSFLTSDSSQDDRLDGHPYKGVMVAYHGVPIMDAGGNLFGSLCHFDVIEQPLSDAEFGRLQAFARALAQYVV